MATRLVLGLLLIAPLAPGHANRGDMPETVCEMMASFAPDWLESHQSGKSVEEISTDMMGSFDRAGLTKDTDRGATFRTAVSVSLIGMAQEDPKSPEAASKVAQDTCATWYRTRGRGKPYKVPDRPLKWH